jgi:hypothetical protein
VIILIHSREIINAAKSGLTVGADRRAADRERLALHLRNLGRTFPNLRRVVLYVWHNLYWDVIDQIDHKLLQPLADAVACLPWRQQQPVTIIVELPYNVFNQLRRAAPQQGIKLEECEGENNSTWLRYCTASLNKEEVALGGDRNSLSNCFYYIKDAQ